MWAVGEGKWLCIISQRINCGYRAGSRQSEAAFFVQGTTMELIIIEPQDSQHMNGTRQIWRAGHSTQHSRCCLRNLLTSDHWKLGNPEQHGLPCLQGSALASLQETGWTSDLLRMSSNWNYGTSLCPCPCLTLLTSWLVSEKKLEGYMDIWFELVWKALKCVNKQNCVTWSEIY